MTNTRYQLLLVWGSAIAGAAIAFVTQAYIGRAFLPQDFGEFNFALVLATLVATFAFQGVGDITLRKRGDFPLQQLILSVFVLSLIGITTAALVLMFIPKDRTDPSLIAACVPYAIAQGGMFIGMAYWQLRDHPLGISLWPLSQQVVKFICVVPIISLAYPISTVPLVWAAALSLLAIYALSKLRLSIASARHTDQPRSSTPNLISAALPFSISRTLEYADIQLPVILAMGLIGSTASGFAAASLIFIQGVLLLPISIFQRLYRGRFHDWAVSNPMKLKHVTRIGTTWMFFIGLTLSISIYLTSQYLLTMVFGDQFSDAHTFLAVISLALPMWFAAIPLNAALVSKPHAKVRVYLQLTSIAIVALGSVLLVPTKGLPGIGWAVCMSQFVLVVGAALTLYAHRQAVHSKAS